MPSQAVHTFNVKRAVAEERLGIIYHTHDLFFQKSTRILGVMLRVLTPSGFPGSNSHGMVSQ